MVQLQSQQEMMERMAEQTRKYDEMLSAEQTARKSAEDERDRAADQAMQEVKQLNKNIFSTQLTPPDPIPEMTVFVVHAGTNSQKNISIHERDSVEVLRHEIDQIMSIQRLGWTMGYDLLYNGILLVSSKFLVSYGIEDGDVIRFVPMTQVEHFAMNPASVSLMSPSPSRVDHKPKSTELVSVGLGSEDNRPKSTELVSVCLHPISFTRSGRVSSQTLGISCVIKRA